MQTPFREPRRLLGLLLLLLLGLERWIRDAEEGINRPLHVPAICLQDRAKNLGIHAREDEGQLPNGSIPLLDLGLASLKEGCLKGRGC